MKERFSRQTVIPEWGEDSQRIISEARVLCVGVGGLGTAASQYLAATGIGTLGLIDADEVSVSNLQRQILFQESDVGEKKAVAAGRVLQKGRADLRIETWTESLTTKNVDEIFARFDLILDCTDNFQTKFLINEACVKLAKPWVLASANQWEGHVAVFYSPKGPCYQCYQRAVPTSELPSCERTGVLGAVVGIVGSYQCLLGLRTLIQLSRPQTTLTVSFGEILFFDFLKLKNFKTHIRSQFDCRVCGALAEPIDWGPQDFEISPAEFSRRIQESTGIPQILNFSGQTFSKFSPIKIESLYEPDFLAGYQKDKEILIVCDLGHIAKEIVPALREKGFTKVWSLRGGHGAWLEESRRETYA